MLKKVTLILHFALENQEQFEALKDAILPLYQHAIVVNEGMPNEERGFIELENCYHDEGNYSCERVGRWEVGRGRVFP